MVLDPVLAMTLSAGGGEGGGGDGVARGELSGASSGARPLETLALLSGSLGANSHVPAGLGLAKLWPQLSDVTVGGWCRRLKTLSHTWSIFLC
ncbi:hypothetical protein E2C01_047177 [Portunus trituberculatus]|uniref:Uncharacterized protein n=1 Tax=Portunus trituberculatus TaxID=210409 RepID=A0A5B7G840_PORTR|nr:hypothetical protein [Portunus trituberculatus]